MPAKTETPSQAAVSPSDSCLSAFNPAGNPSLKKIQDIQDWILSPQVQIPDGPHRGGVAGWLDEKGSPEFLYVEVAGYYLAWLAFLAKAFPSDQVVASHARLALRWISDQFSAGNVPPTRLYLRNTAQDWRNNVMFSFDASILARGVALSSDFESNGVQTDTLARILHHLSHFIDGDRLIRPYIRVDRPPASPLPDRWSLAAGPHQLKTAAAIVALPPNSVPPELAAAAERLYWRMREPLSFVQSAGETHPLLYYLEGLLLAAAVGFDEDAYALAAPVYTRLMASQLPEGGLPAHLGDFHQPLRSDVQAQALRVGCVLRNKGYVQPVLWDLRLEGLAMTLLSFIQSDGSVAFCRKENERHRNTWSAIFAHQALCFFRTLSCGQTIPDGWLKLLI